MHKHSIEQSFILIKISKNYIGVDAQKSLATPDFDVMEFSQFEVLISLCFKRNLMFDLFVLILCVLSFIYELYNNLIVKSAIENVQYNMPRSAEGISSCFIVRLVEVTLLFTPKFPLCYNFKKSSKMYSINFLLLSAYYKKANKY